MEIVVTRRITEDLPESSAVHRVARTHHAVPESIHPDRVFDRHHRPVGIGGFVELTFDGGWGVAVLLKETVDDVLAHHVGQEVVHDDPLVVPAGQATSIREIMTLIHQDVVKFHEGDMQLADDQVLVVAGVADERSAT